MIIFASACVNGFLLLSLTTAHCPSLTCTAVRSGIVRQLAELSADILLPPALGLSAGRMRSRSHQTGCNACTVRPGDALYVELGPMLAWAKATMVVPIAAANAKTMNRFIGNPP